MSKPSPIDPFLEQQGLVLLDGGLATELENLGHDLNHPLWSARLLVSKPEDILKVHRSYLEAGADCITCASYQASVPGFVAEGMSEKQARSLMQKSVVLACEARDEYLECVKSVKVRSIRPLVAASIGPYGAYLADGSEYRGNYGISSRELRAFHEPRWETLAESSADLFACETIPSFQEAEVLLELLQETPAAQAWVSFSCQDYVNISDGTPIAKCAALFTDCEQVVAVGVNCTPPLYISSLIEQVRRGAPTKPIVVYPNSGEIYDATRRVWIGIADTTNFGKAASEWRSHGAFLLGGCCRTGPRHIKAMREALLNRDVGKDSLV